MTVSLINSERFVEVSREVHWMAPLVLLILHLLRGLVLNGSHLGTLVFLNVLVVDPLFVKVLKVAPLAGFRVNRLTTPWSLISTRDVGLTKYLRTTRCLTLKLGNVPVVRCATVVNIVDALGALSLQPELLNSPDLLNMMPPLCSMVVKVVPKCMCFANVTIALPLTPCFLPCILIGHTSIGTRPFP